MMPEFKIGFQNYQAISKHSSVEGVIPQWLRGTYLRNGSGSFHFAKQNAQHWFDGLSLISKFQFTDSGVTYQSNILATQEAKSTTQIGHYQCGQFATKSGFSFWHNLANIFKTPQSTDNTAVNVFPCGQHGIAMTETNIINQFDIANLDQVQAVQYPDDLHYQISTAHPHYDFQRQQILNLGIEVGRKSFYHLFYMDINTFKRELVCSIAVKNIGYHHSFAMSENYCALFHTPLQASPIKLWLASKGFGPAYIENFRWRSGAGTELLLIDRKNNSHCCTIDLDDIFIFHIVNSYEQHHELIIDAICYPNANIIKNLYLENVIKKFSPQMQLQRFIVDLQTQKVKTEPLSDFNLEFSRFNYSKFATKDSQFYYSAAWDNSQGFFIKLVKTDLKNSSEKVWQAEHCYPGEPLFIRNPGLSQEDAGVVIAIVLDTQANSSFLLMLDAIEFTELARVNTGEIIPFGLHGNFEFSN